MQGGAEQTDLSTANPAESYRDAPTMAMRGHHHPAAKASLLDQTEP